MHLGKRCALTESKCNYTAVMPSMINDVGLWNQTIQPMANYHSKNKPWCEQVSGAGAQNVSECVFMYCGEVNGGTSSSNPISVRPLSESGSITAKQFC